MGASHYLKTVLQKALQKDPGLLDFLLEKGQDGLWIWDLAAPTHLWMNPKLCNLMGSDAQEVSHTFATWEQLLFVEDRALLQEKAMAHFQQTDQPYQETARFFDQTGRWKWMRCTYQILPNTPDPKRYLLGGLIDLESKKDAETAPNSKEDLPPKEGYPYLLKTDRQGRYLYANDLFCEQFNTSPEKLFGLSGLVHIIPEDHEQCRRLAERCIVKPNVPHKAVLRKPLPGGGHIAVEWEFTALTNQSGEFEEILCIGLDLGKWQQVEKNLEEQEQLYRSVVSALREGLVVQDMTNQIVMANESAGQILGLTPEQLMGKDSYDPRWQALQEDGQPFLPEMHPSMITLRTGQPVDNVIMNVLSGKGERKIISINSRPVLDGKGNMAGSVASFSDITDQKQFQLAIQQSEGRFRAFANQLSGQVFIKYPAGKHVFGNEHTLEFLGIDLETYQNSTAFDLFDPEIAQDIHKKDLEVFENQQLLIREFYLESVGKWYEEHKFPINEELIGGFLLDITTRRKADAALKMTEQLKIKNKEMEQFAYVASHDLQEPLRTVMSFVSLLRRNYQGKLDPQADEYLQIITGASSRMSQLIKGLLTYSRIGINTVRTSVNLDALVQTVLTDMAAVTQQADVVITVGKLPTLEVYELELRLLFQNLISNAIKFQKSDTPLVIQIQARQEENDWIFSVQDNGIGIAGRHQELIFKIFQRLHTVDKFEGTGIGLANCRKIVELHRGTIWVESVPDQGSTFFFSLKT